MAKVWFSVLMERTVLDQAATALFDVMRRAGMLGYQYIAVPYAPTVKARQAICDHFLREAQEDADTLIMLDCDHCHPWDILERLVEPGLPLVAALAYRRSEPYDPQLYRMVDGELRQPSNVGDALVEVDAVGFGAVAIQRGTFQEIEGCGLRRPWYRYSDDGLTEDIYFCALCRQAGVKMYCDTGLITPHLALAQVADAQWQATLAKAKARQAQAERQA